MDEPLIVNASRLENAGVNLAGLTFPVPPPPVAVPGADPVSAAINNTLPVIESAVVDGLPVIEAAFSRTGSNIATAAEMYSKMDQHLGDQFSQLDFVGAEETAAVRAAESDELPIVPELPSIPEVKIPTAGEIAQASGQASQLLGYSSQFSNVMNQMMGQVQQVAQTAQQNQGAAKPADEHPAEEHPAEEHPAEEHPAEEHPAEEHPAEEAPDQGAESANDAAERAPIEVVASDPEPVPELFSAKRMV